jgi:hypothetical protein
MCGVIVDVPALSVIDRVFSPGLVKLKR